MPTTRTISDPLSRLRITAVRMSMFFIMVIAAVAFMYDRIAAQGVLLGGIAGVLGFWVIAIRLEKVARTNPSKVQYASLTWSFYRYLLYGVVLYRAFKLDVETYHGLLGALVGIFVIHYVLIYIGIRGRTLQEREQDQQNEDSVEAVAVEDTAESLDETDG